MKKFIKEFLTSYTQEGIIYNCREKSICWWHEKGHIERFKDKRILSLYGYVILFGTPALFFTRDYPLLFKGIAMFWAIMLFCIEADAWIYAYKRWQ